MECDNPTSTVNTNYVSVSTSLIIDTMEQFCLNPASFFNEDV